MGYFPCCPLYFAYLIGRSTRHPGECEEKRRKGVVRWVEERRAESREEMERKERRQGKEKE
jgi:hypothetical protein